MHLCLYEKNKGNKRETNRVEREGGMFMNMRMRERESACICVGMRESRRESECVQRD